MSLEVRSLSAKLERPKVTIGITIKRKTQCGSIYVQVCGDGNGHDPIETFATLGKAGGCTNCQLEALTRAITIGLKYGVPVKEYIEQLKNIECPSKVMWPEADRTLSCPDGVARALEEYIANCKA